MIAKSLRIRFDKIERFIRVYDETRYLEVKILIPFMTGYLYV